jgi:hypothetical protein
METLHEEFLCAVPGRFVNIAITWLLAAQRGYFAAEDEIRAMDDNDNLENEFGL